MKGDAMTLPDPMDAVQARAPETRPFWEAAREHRFVLPVCTDCGRAHWFPRATCPLCGAPRIEWRAASGRGTVYSVSVARRTAQPYALAYVALDEGPTLLTEIVDTDLDRVAIGDRVAVRFRETPGALPAPVFAPMTEGSP